VALEVSAVSVAQAVLVSPVRRARSTVVTAATPVTVLPAVLVVRPARVERTVTVAPAAPVERLASVVQASTPRERRRVVAMAVPAATVPSVAQEAPLVWDWVAQVALALMARPLRAAMVVRVARSRMRRTRPCCPAVPEVLAAMVEDRRVLAAMVVAAVPSLRWVPPALRWAAPAALAVTVRSAVRLAQVVPPAHPG
jgi:hypothetical protein